MSKFTQSLGLMNTDGRYENSDSYYEDRWENFYNVLTQYRVLENVNNNLKDEDKSDYEVFVLLARIFVYDHLIQVADCWGDVPFSKAGYLAVTGDVAVRIQPTIQLNLFIRPFVRSQSNQYRIGWYDFSISTYKQLFKNTRFYQ
jgi:hypothetical protein